MGWLIVEAALALALLLFAVWWTMRSGGPSDGESDDAGHPDDTRDRDPPPG